MKSIIRGILLSLALVFTFSTCDNLIGLGSKVNTEKPVIRTPEDAEFKPGDFLHGKTNKIWLDVEQEYGVARVYMDVEYIEVETGIRKRIRTEAFYDEGKNQWYTNVDTTDMMDGKITAWVTAIDVDGNTSTTTDIIYTVKNMLPQIKLYIPSVAENDFDNKAYLDSLVLADPIYQGLDIMGLATDEAGIADGWPKIMFWPETLTEKDEDGLPSMNQDGSPVSAEFGSWRTVVLPTTYKTGAAATKFSWPFARLIRDNSDPTGYRLPKNGSEFVSLEVNKKYRFRIWTRDSFGNDNFFPNRTDNKRNGGKQADPNTAERKYIEVMYKAIGDVPMVSVPTMKRYYNRAGDFVVEFTVIGSSFNPNPDPDTGAPRDTVEANITNTNTGSDITAYNPTPFYAKYIGDTGKSPYLFKLTITAEEAATWGSGPSEKQVFLELTPKYGEDQSEKGVTDYQYFILDETPPEIVIDQPTILDNKIAEGKLTGGYYSILYPTKKVTTDSRPKWVTAKVITGGRNTDVTGIEKVYYHLGMIRDSDGNPISDDQMTSNTEREAIYYKDDDNLLDEEHYDGIWKDTFIGTSKMLENWSGSVYSWTYTYTYDRNIDYKTDLVYSKLVQDLSDLDISKLGNPSGNDIDYGTDASNFTTQEDKDKVKARFYLPLYVRVVDYAGNSQIMHYKLSIDPALDDPQTNFIYPDSNSTVGGTVRLSGTAEDNVWINKVLIRIHKAGKPANEYYIPTTTPGTQLFYNFNPSFPKPKKGGVETTEGWFEATKIGNGAVVSWTCPVNQEGGLNPEGGDSAPETVDVTIEAVAIDSNTANGAAGWLAGPIETRTVRFSSKVPRIENVKVSSNGASASGGTVTGGKLIRDYYDGMSAAGKFIISMRISAQDGINTILAKINNGVPVTIIANEETQTTIDGSVWSISGLTTVAENRKEATLTVTVDSTGPNPVVPGIGWGKTGVMNMEITVEDATTTKFSTTNSFRIGIDNYFPNAKIETPTVAVDDPADDPANSKYFLVQGTAQDWGGNSPIEIQDLERMLVYFERAKIEYPNGVRTITGNGTMLKPDGTNASSNDFEEYLNVMDTTIPGWNESLTTPNRPTNFPMPILTKINSSSDKMKSNAAMVIDTAENDPNSNWDNDDTYGEGWNGLTDKTWQARMMISLRTPPYTQRFSDGPYIVHYVIMDKAGNATHYQKDIYVANNKPLITGINVGTDIDFSGTVTTANPDEYRPNAFDIDVTSEARNTQVVPPNDFRIRNSMFGFKLNLQKGNGQKFVAVTNVTRSTNPIPVTSMEIGRVYQIAVTQQDTDFTKYGAPNGYVGTVFVATGKGEGTGTVYSFTDTKTSATRQLFDNLGTGTSLNPVFTFNKFTGVADNTASYFIVKVWDTAFTTSATNGSPDAEYDQLASAVLLTVNVNNNDTTPPTIDVTNFGQKWIIPVGVDYLNDTTKKRTDLADAVYSDYAKHDASGIKEGYVQYQADSPNYTPTTNTNTGTGTAYISGKVIFNGKVSDNHIIEKITAAIPGYNPGINIQNGEVANTAGAEFIIAKRNATTGRLEAANTITGEREFGYVYPSLGSLQFSLAYGHTLTWTFMWDSSKIATSAANGVGIVFRVYDSKNNGPNNTTFVSQTKTVNIVPYISEIVTPLSGAYATSPSAFNRSALGGYPVREGDTITIKGFNFGTTLANGTTNNVTIGGGANYVTVTARNNTSITGTVSDALASGNLEVRTNNIPSFNNSTSKSASASYNQEPNKANNNVLDNSRYIYVWRTGYLMNQYAGLVKNPFFRMGIDGRRYMTFGTYDTNGRWRVLVDNTYQGTSTAGTPNLGYLENATNRYLNLTLAVDQAGSWYSGASNMTSGTTYNFTFFARTQGTSTGNDAQGNNKRRILAMNNNGTVNENRVRIPRIYAYNTNGNTQNNNGFVGGTTGAQANNTRIFMSYYDGNSSDNPVVFRYGTVGNNNQFGGDLGYDSATGRNETNAGTSAWGSFPGTTLATMNSYRQIVADNTSVKARSGEYTAVGGLSNGRPVIAWYDTTNNKLWFSYGNLNATMSNTYDNANARVTTPTQDWQDHAKDVDTGRGSHVDMAVDGSNNVHLAYYDSSNGGLYYAFIPNNGGTPDTSKIQTVPVDTYLVAGTKLMINIRREGTNDVPYITYYHGTFTETRNAIRVAWRKDFTTGTTTIPPGTNPDDTFTGKWEVMTVPVNAVPLTNEFICNGVPNPGSDAGSWADPNLANGVAGVTALTRGTVNIRRTIVVGYMTNNYYEGAMLKGDMSAGLSAK